MMFAPFLAVLVIVLFNLASTNGQIKSCGGTINIASRGGVESSNNFPYDVGDNVACKWWFIVPNTTVSEFVYVVVRTLDYGDNISLSVFDHHVKLELPKQLATPFTFAISPTDGNSINFKTGNISSSSNLRRISFEWHTTDSPIILNNILGVVESPSYVLTLNSELSLSWIVSGNPGRSIALAFAMFNISGGLLTVNETNGQVQTFTGSTVPSDILVSTPNVALNLKMPMNVTGYGFKLFYKEVIESCSQEVSLNDTTIVDLNVSPTKLPGFCVWLLKGPEDTILSATIRDIDTGVDASDGYLSFHDGGGIFSKSLGLFATSALAKDSVLLTSGNRLFISYFYHNSSVPNITVAVIVHNHGGTLQIGGQFGVSPSASNATSSANSSVWSLVVDTNKQVRVDIASLSLNDRERIEFFDGNRISSDNLLFSLDENSTIIPVVSSKNEMIVVANIIDANDTFNASFSAISDGDFLLSSTDFGSHTLFNLESKTNFTWVIKPNTNETSDIIALMFNLLNIKAGTSTLLVYEGLTMDGFLLANVTNPTSELVFHLNAVKGALIVYSNIGPNASSGVLMTAFYKVFPRCSWNVTVATEFVLSSPLYPKSYPINADCTFIVTAAENKTLLMSFEEVDLADNHILTVFDGNASVANLTGTNAPDDYISKGSSVLLKFLTRSLPTNLTAGRGYRIRIVALDCGGHLTDAHAEISTPKYPETLKNTTLCIWSIDLPILKDVDIISLAIESKAPGSSSPATLRFIDGGTLHSLSSDVINSSTTSFLSRTGKLMIVYNYTQDAKVDGMAYKFSYSTLVCPQLCKNGLCLHDDWKCNGINECGDFTDEYNCTATPTVVESGGVGVATFVVMMFILFFTGVAVALAAPHLWRRVRSPRHYQSFGGAVDA